MKPLKGRTAARDLGSNRECLLRHADLVAESKRASFEEGELAWEASTLPLSYTRL